MKIITFHYSGSQNAGVLVEGGVVPVLDINAKHHMRLPNNVLEIIRAGVTEIPTKGIAPIPLNKLTPELPYAVPPKIWCIGLNYKSHAADINAVQPEEPGSFMKPASCMFQPGGDIILPPTDLTNDVDAEGELGVIIGKTCRFLEPEQVKDAIYGYTTTLDLTALDVLAKNPRYLTRAKSFDTFFSFGPVIVTADESSQLDVDALEVITDHNGVVSSSDYVSNMRHRPFDLVRLHSQYMTLHPGYLSSTGCPKGARIKPGDRVRARIDGVGTTEASVHGHDGRLK